MTILSWRIPVGFMVLFFASFLAGSPCFGIAGGAGFPGLASGVLGAPVAVGSLSFQVICAPEYVEVHAPLFARELLGTGTLAVFGRVQPRDLLVTHNGSWSVMPLTGPDPSPSFGWAIGYLGAVGEQVKNDVGNADFGALLSLLGDESQRRRLKFWAFAGCSLALLVAGVWASGLLWRSALALAYFPGASFILGGCAVLGAAGVVAGFFQSPIGPPFLVIPLLAFLPLLPLLPMVAAGALVMRVFKPERLFGGLMGMAVVLPLILLLPAGGRGGCIAFGVICCWAFGGILLSRIPGTGHLEQSSERSKEETHVQEILDPDPDRPCPDPDGVRPDGERRIIPAPDVGQSGEHPQAEPSCQHGPGDPDRRG